jgi:CRISPR-associated endonuclease/helicase Cas3
LWEEHLFRLGSILRRTDPIKQKFDNFKEPYFLINLLFSSLLDADSMNVANLVPERDEVRTDAVTSYLKTKKNDDDHDNINRLRKMLYRHVEQKVDEQDLIQRIFTLTAPTGLGKTLTSINFALKMRDKIRRKNGFVPRIIYVAPFIAILDQNMKVLQQVFDTNQQTKILLMHHHLAPINFRKDLVEEQKTEYYSTSQSELLIQGWNSEVVVTTLIQFFNSVFGRYKSQLRRLKNLTGSIIILDEVQSIPFEYWNAVRDVLLFLSKIFSFTIIMMTATQPLIFTEFEAIEIAPIDALQIPNRVIFHPRTKDAVKLKEFCMEMNWLIKNNHSESILIEVNTIATAIKVYESLQVPNKIFFLSSQIIPKDRKPRIDMIKESLEKSEPIVLVSTQVIEAGVDLDFDIAIRDIGPIDSIVQTAGRCNRNGNRNAPSPFFIYRIVDDDGSEVAKKVYGRVSIDIANYLLEGASNVVDLVKPYYQSIKKQRSSQKSDDINMAISKLNYDEVEEAFKLIDEEYKVPVFVEFDDDATKIWDNFLDLKDSKEKPSRNKIIETRNQMEQYMIGVSPQDIKASNLEEFHGIYKINNSDIGILYKEITGFVK